MGFLAALVATAAPRLLGPICLSAVHAHAPFLGRFFGLLGQLLAAVLRLGAFGLVLALAVTHLDPALLVYLPVGWARPAVSAVPVAVFFLRLPAHRTRDTLPRDAV